MVEYKYAIFFISSLVGVPVGILLASSNRKMHDLIFILLVFATCMPDSLFGLPTDINFMSREWYRGSTRGIEISYLDLLALILLFSSLHVRRREGKPLFWTPSLGYLLAFFGWCLLNVVFFSDPKLFGVFELTKVARGILLFVAVAAYIRSPREIRLFIWTLVITIFFEAGVALRDRYYLRMHRIHGTLGHPNSLSMYCLQCAPIFIATFFSVDTPRRLRIATIIAYVAATGCILLTISRTGFAALILLSGLAFVLCTGLRLTPRNIGLALLGVILATLMVAKSYDTIMSRLGGFNLESEYLSEQGDGDRGGYFRRAAPAISDNPIFGVGLNNWSWWITNRYAAEAGYTKIDGRNAVPYPSVDSPPYERGQFPPAHNLYLITLTELGIPGLLLLLALFIRWLWINGSILLSRHDQLMELFQVGIFLSLCGMLLQSLTEWEFRQTHMYFLGHVIMAVGASLYYYRNKAQ